MAPISSAEKLKKAFQLVKKDETNLHQRHEERERSHESLLGRNATVHNKAK